MAHELAYVKTREMLISPNTAITLGSLSILTNFAIYFRW